MTAFSKLSQLFDAPPAEYDREPTYDNFVSERDIPVAMRDGVKLCVDIYRPESNEKFPALLAARLWLGMYNRV